MRFFAPIAALTLPSAALAALPSNDPFAEVNAAVDVPPVRPACK